MKKKTIEAQVQPEVSLVFIVFDNVLGNIDSVWLNKEKAQQAMKEVKYYHNQFNWVIKEFEIKG